MAICMVSDSIRTFFFNFLRVALRKAKLNGFTGIFIIIAKIVRIQYIHFFRLINGVI